MAHRQKFVVVGTSLSFILILGLWIPFEISRIRATFEKATTAANNTNTNEASPSPVVAGDSTVRIGDQSNKQNLPFLSGGNKKVQEPTAAPTASSEPTPDVTPVPDSSDNTPLLNDVSPSPVSESPAASDFPTL